MIEGSVVFFRIGDRLRKTCTLLWENPFSIVAVSCLFHGVGWGGEPERRMRGQAHLQTWSLHSRLPIFSLEYTAISLPEIKTYIWDTVYSLTTTPTPTPPHTHAHFATFLPATLFPSIATASFKLLLQVASGICANSHLYHCSIRCWSYVGDFQTGQIVSIGRNCEYKHIVEHELLHALGFYHEQSRSDRDDYVTIWWNEVIVGKK